jgi:ABC-type phosphate transport system permease subunit
MQLHSYIFLFISLLYIYFLFLRAQLCTRAVQAEDNCNKKKVFFTNNWTKAY